ncbi:MAG: GNAT family N-acetyltransferase [Solirubrobacterales bacterium]
MGAHRVVEIGVDEVDRVGPLFEALVGFHRDVIDGAWPVRSDEAGWARRREQYLEWLRAGEALMLAAVPAADPAGAPSGYAVVTTKPSPASWDIGGRIGELETLSVTESARGEGIGTMLIEAARERLRAEGVSHWMVAVVEANDDATRLYERLGFHPYYRQLLAEV